MLMGFSEFLCVWRPEIVALSGESEKKRDSGGLLSRRKWKWQNTETEINYLKNPQKIEHLSENTAP